MTTLAETILRDVPTSIDGTGVWLDYGAVIEALTAALDPAIAERAGEVLEGVTDGWSVYEMPNLKHDANARFIAWARDNVPALLAQNAALRAERDAVAAGDAEATRLMLGAQKRMREYKARAEAAEAQNAALTARVEGLTGAGKALASWCVKNIQPNLEMDTLLHALDAALSTTEEGHE